MKKIVVSFMLGLVFVSGCGIKTPVTNKSVSATSEVKQEKKTELLAVQEVAINQLSSDGKVTPFEGGNSSWNYLDNYMVQVLVVGEDNKKDYSNVVGKNVDITVTTGGKIVLKDFKKIENVKQGGSSFDFVVKNDLVGCQEFTVEASISGQSVSLTKSNTHTGVCGE